MELMETEARAITTKSIEFLEIERAMKGENFMRWLEKPKGSKIPLWTKLEAGAWSGQRCFIIGGGTSLVDFDFDRLGRSGERVIVCNRGFVEAPFADIMIAMDIDLYNWLEESEVGRTHEEQIAITKAFHKFKGLKVWIDMNNSRMNAPVHYVLRESRPVIHKRIKNGIFSGNNVGVGALCLAATLGASPIYLLGYDFYLQKSGSGKITKTHFHSGYPRKMTDSHVNSFVHFFKIIKPAIYRRGIRVYNMNRKSKLRIFPFADFK